MSSQSVKKTVTSRVFSSSRVSGQSSSSAAPGGRTSPARISRLQEKEELTTLNDRLAAYIDHIRSLETDNERLTLQIQSYEETTRREVDSTKALYEKELAAARKLVDEIAKENAKLSVSAAACKAECEEWMRKYHKRERDIGNLEKKNGQLEAQLADLQKQLAAALADKDRWQNEYAKIRGDVNDLERQLASARKQLEEETLQKVDLENKVQSLKEELAFKAQLHQSELNETRTRTEISMQEVDTRAQREYESRLLEALADFRQQHEVEMKKYREEMEYIYESKISALQQEMAQNDGFDEKIRIEISGYKSRISELQAQIGKLTNQNASLEARIAMLEADLVKERDQSKALYELKDREIRLLKEQLNEQMREYQDLLDIKVSLDLEIAAYRKLLEAEEERLNISRNASQSDITVTPKKRKLVDETDSYIRESNSSSSGLSTSSHSSGELEITEVSSDGRFVKVKNISSKVVSLRDWSVVTKAGTDETVYKFHRSAKLSPGETATIWSADSNANHDPSSHNYVMKGLRWFTSDSMVTKLLNKNNQEVAVYETSQSKRVVLAGRRRTGFQSEELFHAQGDPGTDNKSCSIM